ncbi:alkaline phosphatase family protein [Undibacterium macrobrachii]|uniref:Alkaline phosphatase family protein n=1 Tax=Undibacterium macrobrachii TaxID=1119058 RepID=A0ABQ2XHB9_9BURK|nr:alkaline phosphatase family protein [Undibacterium macrobrachii]GGX14677.1 alkaline phosphatase family protein [Undibacterium macrobrachii]
MLKFNSKNTPSKLRRGLLAGFATFALSSHCYTALAANLSQGPQITKAPKLILVLVVDGLPNEQVQRYRHQFGEGGFKRLLEQGAWFGNAHQAHGITVTAVGHSAVLTGAYPYQHGIIGNNWFDPNTSTSVYCTEDRQHTYIGTETKSSDGTSPANLKVSTVGDELRYATGNRSKVLTVSGKDRGAILLAGKTGTAYMLMKKTGAFASSTYYMNQHPAWHTAFHASKPQDRFYGKQWTNVLPEHAYHDDAHDDVVAPANTTSSKRLPYTYDSASGKPDAEYYEKLFTGPYVDELTLDFANAAIDGEKLGNNPTGATDILGVSLSSHDYVNHTWGPESKMSHDHLQRLDRLLAKFLNNVDKKVGLDNTLVVLTADHGFANVPEFSQSIKRDANRLDGNKMSAALNQHLFEKFGVEKLIRKWSAPYFFFDYSKVESKGITRTELENTAARFILNYQGVASTYTRTQFEQGQVPNDRISRLVQRAWHKQLSGDLMVVVKPYWYFGSTNSGTSHGTPYTYDTNVPLIFMGKPWFKAGAYSNYAEVMDIAPTLSHLLRLRLPSGSEGRVLTETLK